MHNGANIVNLMHSVKALLVENPTPIIFCDIDNFVTFHTALPVIKKTI